jgi:phenylacetate-CoA ligase
VACECIEAADGLHVNEDHFLVETIAGATGEPAPDGTPGELVFSTVTREALPLLRYRTGDIASLRHGTCVCGRTLVKMSKVTGRRDDMLVVRGVKRVPQRGGAGAARRARDLPGLPAGPRRTAGRQPPDRML